ncbi:integrase family protein [Leptothrix cholodnii SP-6]|uniref:Integrase family protein n=1 Tax=Leptothrix cholodnii (strain ATCC 51168 / LMG 8142 / SP-6) TaxID=395495 RepID=B1XZ52_LEPCP|nr:tyrosine-type recombinase/integrase [Leptothrix cholodnii]ACB34071.1 integrase family protein [Leptothrix cholodnii SP-6]
MAPSMTPPPIDPHADRVVLRPDDATPVLLPDELPDSALAAVRALLDQGESPNTVRSYRSGLRYWAAWFSLRYGRPLALPLPVTVVLQFVVDHAQRLDEAGRLVHELPVAVDAALVAAGHKAAEGAPTLATLVHRISVLSKLHQLQGLPNPCSDGRVRELLSRTRRGYARRGAQQINAKPALTREALERLLATCDDSLAGRRDRALLLFAFASGGRRRSEVTAATLENTRRVGSALAGAPAAGWIYQMGVSKSNQAGLARADGHKPIVGRAAEALEAWLDAWRTWAAAAGAPAPAGPIFRRVRKALPAGAVAEPLTPQSVRDIVRRRCALAGLDEGFSAHSLRSGFVTEAAAQNIPMAETMALTGHRSPASVLGYFRKGEVLNMRGASLLDADAQADNKKKP